MRFQLSERAAAAGYRLATFETIGSTSAEALSRARAGETGPLWLVSDHQSAGTGRRGSAWQTPRGNLAATLLLTTDFDAPVVAQLGFVAGVALAEALTGLGSGDSFGVPRTLTERGSPDAPHAEVAGEAGPRSMRDRGASFEAPLHGAPQDEEEGRLLSGSQPHASGSGRLRQPSVFQLKWPNDVLADGAKLAGILLGTEVVGARRAVAIGIGVNVVTAPDDLSYRATSLSDLGRDPDPAALFAALSTCWLDTYRAWDEGRGFDAIRRSWLARAAGIGGAVAVRGRAGVTNGTFETIDGTGQLVLRAPDGAAHHVSAGEVLFGGAATARPEIRV